MIEQCKRTAAKAESLLLEQGIRITLGGEPTFVPLCPAGPEWQFAALGPTKLTFAKTMAAHLMKTTFQNGISIFTPGKLYPGELNPRWAIKLVANRNGSPLFTPPAQKSHKSSPEDFGKILCHNLKVHPHWLKFRDPTRETSWVQALPLDHDGMQWISSKWPLPQPQRTLLAAEGPAGLRLPLQTLPPEIPKRVLVLESSGEKFSIFIPPLLQNPFLSLLITIQNAADSTGLAPDFAGYLPPDDDACWIVLGISADPGVLEVNLPASKSWEEYASWLEIVTRAAEAAGLRPWKELVGEPDEGTGGGNHVLWGGASIESNPFFERPGWLSRILRYWQRHPSLSYFFTGCYVGASSQAPRPDESAKSLEDLEMAFSFLESLAPGDHRNLINETLRHLLTDVTGNVHRSEISFDKFWNPQWPGGALGLIEFRAVESMPRPDWMAAPALLFHCIAAMCLKTSKPDRLREFGRRLHDAFFLPTVLLHDLLEVLGDLQTAGLPLPDTLYREIFEWKFPRLFESPTITIRKAHEEWPLLCETPLEGGNTSRFVDTSVRRIEISLPKEFAQKFDVYVNGRSLTLRPFADLQIAGLRYRRTRLYPSLHPGIPPQVPLDIALVDKASHRITLALRIDANASTFSEIPPNQTTRLVSRPCRKSKKSDWTFDLRLP